MASIDDDLNQLEKDIRQAKIEFEQYFGGGRKRAPQDTVWRIEALVKKYAEMGGRINYAQRFRYNNLSSTFAKYKDLWGKKLKKKEEGFVDHHFGAAAREVEKMRGEKRKKEAPAAEPAPAPVAARRAAAGGHSVAVSDPDRDGEKVQEFYRALVEAKKKAGESTDSLTLDGFKQFVRQKTAQLKQQKGAGEVEYAFSVEGGQVKLKARVKS